MALDTYTSLVTAVSSNWMHRSDLSTVTEDFIDLFESEFNSSMRLAQMQQSTSIASTSGYLPHPSQWRGWKQLELQNGTDRYNLTPISEESQILETGREGNTTPRHYVVRNDKTYLFPPPSSTVTVNTIYYEGVTALSTAKPSNWLLASYPGAYLYGALNEASSYVVDDARVPLWKQKLNETLQKLLVESDKIGYGDQVLKMRPDIKVR